MTTATSSPKERRAEGSEPTTSARPPVLAKGAASEETMRTRVTRALYQARERVGPDGLLNRVVDTTNARAVSRGQTLVQSPDFRQTTPGIRGLSRVCGQAALGWTDREACPTRRVRN